MRSKVKMVIEEEKGGEKVEEKQVTEIPRAAESFETPIEAPVSPHNHFQSEQVSSHHQLSIIGDDYRDPSSIMTVFPPSNHEGLLISSFHTHHETPPEFNQSLPDGDVDHPSSPLRKCSISEEVTRWLDLGFNFLRCKVKCIASMLQNYSVSFRSPVAMVATAMLVVLWYLNLQRQRRRLLIRKGSRDQLIRIIREKDERINQLLHQIAQMNEILLGVRTLKPDPTA